MRRKIDLGVIKFKNFVIYRNREFDLTEAKGVVSFIGDNGSGKSTILDGIWFLFYGEGKHKKLLDLFNRDALNTGAKKCSIGGTFFLHEENSTNGGIKHEIVREINNRGNMTSKLYIEEKLFSDKQGAVQEYLDKLLVFPYELIDVTVCSRQRKAARFFELENKEKKELIDFALNLQYDLFEKKITEKIKSYHKLTEKLEARGKSVAEQVEYINKEILTTMESRNESREKLKQTSLKVLTDKVDKQKKQKQGDEAEVEKLEAEKTQIEDNQKEVADLAEKIDKIVKDGKETAETVVKAKEAVVVAETTLNKERKSAKGLKKVAVVDSDKLKLAKEFIEKTEKEVKDKKDSVSTIETDISNFKADIEAANEIIKTMGESKKTGVCPMCKTEVTDHSHFEDEIAKQEGIQLDKVTCLDGAVHTLNRASESLARSKDLLARAKKKSETLFSAYAEYNDANSARTKSGNAITRKRGELGLSKSKLSTAGTLFAAAVKLLAEKSALETKKAGFEAKIKPVAAVDKDIESLDKRIDVAQKLIEAVEAEIDSYKLLEKEIEMYNKTLSTKKEDLLEIKTKYEKCRRAYSKSTEMSADWKFVKKIFEASFNTFVSNSLKYISGMTNQILNDIAPDLSVEMTIDDSGVTSKFVCKVLKDKSEIPFHMASGGQQIMLGESFRLALWLFLITTTPSPINFMTLDEIFGELSQGNASLVFNQLSKFKKYFSSIFFTSHTDHVWDTDHKVMV